MTATPDIIPSDLTLEIDAELSPEKFMAAARAFFGYVQEIAHGLAPEGAKPQWVVRVKEGSSLLGVEPAKSTAPAMLDAIYSRAGSGLRYLGTGAIEESGLSEGALNHLRVLSELTEGPRGKPMPMRLWVKRTPLNVDASIARIIEEDWRTDYKDFGTIEGRLEGIQDKDGSLQLQVHDAMLSRRVRCYFDEEMLAKAFEMFRKRVEVSGLIHYRRNGAPISIDAEHIEPLPEDNDLPSADDVRGLLRLSL